MDLITQSLSRIGPADLTGLFLFYLGMVAALTFSEFRAWKKAQFILKPLLAFGFMALAFWMGGAQYFYGQLIICGLMASAIGDILLLQQGRGRMFVAGMFAFFGAHIFYIFALAQKAAFQEHAAILFISAAFAAVLNYTILKNFLIGAFKPLVASYGFVITLMVAAAIMTSIQTGNWIYAVAAILFALSDMAVGQHRFVSQSRWLFFIITPFYFIAQLLFAMSVGQ